MTTDTDTTVDTDTGTDDGASDDTGTDDATETDLAPEDDPSTVEYWKKRSRQNEREAKRAKREADELRKAPPKDDEVPDLDALKAEAQAEAKAEVLRERVEDKIEAKAKAFADPEDAVAVLLRSHDIDDFIDDGKVDVEAIADALDELGRKKPHLLAEGKRFKGSGDGGARKDSKPSQLTRADLKSMSPEAIVKAKADGRLRDLFAGDA